MTKQELLILLDQFINDKKLYPEFLIWVENNKDINHDKLDKEIQKHLNF